MIVKGSIRKLIPLVLCLAMTLSGMINMTCPVFADGQVYITDIKAGSYGSLEKEGYSVMSSSLTMSGEKMYIGYKTGSGSPVTGLLYGSSKSDGVSYKSAGGGLHYTKDKKAGNPLVGIDVLRPDIESGKNPQAIANDGSVIVRNKDGEPVDFKKGDKTVYLAEIHDGSVMPYIKEVVSVTGSDKDDAVYKAATYGYNYYVDGDVDGSKKTYTILAYERTDNPEEAVTNVTAISADLLKDLIKAQNGLDDEQESEAEAEEPEPEAEPEQEAEPEIPEDESAEQEAAEEEQIDSEDEQEEIDAEQESEDAEQETSEESAEEEQEQSTEEETPQDDVPDLTEDSPENEVETEVPEQESSQDSADNSVSVDAELKLNGDALDLSGIEYDRMSSKVIDGKRPYYIYATKDKNAGNPITMLYVGGEKDTSETTLGIWARGYFTTKGVSNAYSYIVNEESLAELEQSTDVYLRKPVALFEDQGKEEFDIRARLSKISFLTAKEGLPDDDLILNGLIEPSYDAPDIVENERDNPDSDLPASAFSAGNVITLAIGLIVLAIVFRHMTKGQKNGEKKEK